MNSIVNESTVGRIYLVRLNGDGKYTGFTTKTLECRWKEHCRTANAGRGKILHSGIRKYGADAFTIEEIYQSADHEHT